MAWGSLRRNFRAAPSGAGARRTGCRCWGAVPDLVAARSRARIEQPAQVPRMEGLYACTAFGSRGITWAALAAQTVAAVICGTPLPIEASLFDAVDAGRFVSRRSRRPR